MSVGIAKSAPSFLSMAKAAASGLGAVLASIFAAGAAANAVENHRQPAEADLIALGLQGVRFKQYY